jgi:hypothetical protein
MSQELKKHVHIALLPETVMLTVLHGFFTLTWNYPFLSLLFCHLPQLE